MTKIWNYIFGEIFFRINQNLQNSNTVENNTAFSAIIILSILHILNLVSLIIIINYFLKNKLLSESDSTITGLVIAGTIILVNYKSLYHNRKEIFEKYNMCDLKRSERGKTIALSYFVGSIFLFFFLGEFLR